MNYVYSQIKMFHFTHKLEAIKKGTVNPPVHVRLKPINACNHNCFYCCYRNENLFLSEKMDEKDMIPESKMAEIVRDLGDCGVRAVTFTGGGEPLIYPYIDKTIEGLINKRVRVAVLTNGARLSGTTADILASGADWVRISIDSTTPEMMSDARGVDESEFSRIINNISEFSAKKTSDCELGINFIVTQKNKDDIYDFIRLMKNSGADHVKISECIVSTSGDENNLYHSGHFKHVEEQILRAEEELSDSDFHIINKFHDFDDKFEKAYEKCRFIQFINVIAADQSIYTCQDKAYTEAGWLGSIKDGSLKAFWESDEYRKRILEINPSEDCRHHCVQHGKNLMLDDFIDSGKKHVEFV